MRRVADDLASGLGDQRRQGVAPALDLHRREDYLAGGSILNRLRDDEHRQTGGVIRPLHEGQPRDDFRRLPIGETTPPGAIGGAGADPHQAEVARRTPDRLDHTGGAVVRHIRDGEAEMEARGIAHRRIAAGDVDMDAVIRLHEGEGRNNNAPNSLDGIERQQPAVALDQAAHHLGLAAGTEGRAATLTRFHRDQPVDDLAALHQAAMEL